MIGRMKEHAKIRKRLVSGIGRCLGTLVFFGLCLFSVLVAQQQPLSSQRFQLQAQRAAAVAPMLKQILPQEVGITVRPEANELLITGASAELLNYAAEFLAAVDQRVDDKGSSSSNLRTYRCAGDQQTQQIDQLRQRFGSQPEFRISGDPERNRIFVIAPASIHALIEQGFPVVKTSGSPQVLESVEDELALQSPPALRLQSPQGIESERQPQNSLQPTGDKPAKRAETRFVALRGDVSKLQARLSTILGPRLKRDSNSSSQLFTLLSAGQPVADFEFNARRGGVLLTASPAILAQCEMLLAALETAEKKGERRTAIMSIERSDSRKVRRAIDAYKGTPDSRTSSQKGSQNERSLALVNFVMQVEDEKQPATDQPPGVQSLPTGLDVDVEVQTLPDLDVIILRGRDRDVRRLTEVIRELERLSKETQPEVQVYMLRHAQSEAIARIVETVNEDLTGRRQGAVSVTPLVKPNALLLIGWGEAIKAMVELIGKLDQAVAPETQFEVFRLRHAPAVTVVAGVNEFFANRDGLGAKVFALADPRSNSVIAYAAPRDMLEVKRLVDSLDADRSEAVNQAKVIQIKNALAGDLAETLRTAIQADNSDGGPSAILELLTVDQRGQQMIRSGMLTAVRITANVRNNTLIISGPSETLALLEALIREMDTAGAVSQIKVFRVSNGDAASLVQMLRSLLPSQTGDTIAPQLASAAGDTSLAPLRFAVDSRTNSIIAAGSEGDLQIIEALLLRLDERDFAERKNEVYRLRNAPALDVAAAINEFLRSERLVQQAAQAGDFFEQVEREVVVVPEPVRNALIISATPRYFDQIRELVISLDEQPPQVLIQVVIAEVVLNDTDDLGVELGIQDSVLFDRSLLSELLTTIVTTQTSTIQGITTVTEEIIQAADNEPGYDFNNLPLGNSGSKQSLDTKGQVGTQGLTHFGVERTNSERGFGGLVLSASSDSVSILIRALQETRRLDVLSRPQVRTLDNQSAFIQVGQRVPRIVASNLTEGGLQTNTIELENVGLILGVTPRISPDGMVVMEVDAEKSQVGPESEGIPVSVSLDGTIIRSPSIDVQTAQATVSAGSGETIILGGLITTRKEMISRRVPYLSRVPLLGDVFRYDGLDKRRAELLIILTPHVIRNEKDAERLKQIEMSRMSWCAADVYEIQGDIGAPLDSNLILDGDTEVIYPDLNPRGESIEAPEPALLTQPEIDEMTNADVKDSSVQPVLVTDISRARPAMKSDEDKQRENKSEKKSSRFLNAIKKFPGRSRPEKK